MLIIIFIFLLLIALPGFVIYLFYYIPKKAGYPKLGKVIATITALTFISFWIFMGLEDTLFNKKDARELLAEQHFKLYDDFEIMHNQSGGIIDDYYHTFTLKISANDKRRLLNEITHAKNFTKEKDIPDTYSLTNSNSPRVTKNYETTDAYIRDHFVPAVKGYLPTRRILIINKKSNVLTFDEPVY